MASNSFQFQTDVNSQGKVEVPVPIPPGTKVEVRIRPVDGEELPDLLEAAISSTDFWANSWDDEDWNDA